MDFNNAGTKAHLSERLLSIYGQPDYAIAPEKRNSFVFNVAKVGGCLGLISILFRRSVTFKEVISSQKKFIALQVAKGYVLGGVTAGIYVGTVEQVSKFRGNQDGALNHFFAGFAGIAPYTILYKQTYRFFFIGGAIWGVMLMLLKSAGKTKFFDNLYAQRRMHASVTRYPEIYVYAQTKRDITDGKFA